MNLNINEIITDTGEMFHILWTDISSTIAYTIKLNDEKVLPLKNDFGNP